MEWMIYLWPLLVPAIFFAGILLIDHARVKRLKAHFDAEDARRAARTPQQVWEEGRQGAIMMCGYDVGPWTQEQIDMRHKQDETR